MDTFGLLRIADKVGVPVYNFKTSNKKAFCTQGAVALDFCRIETDRECKELLAEEMGHVMTDACYPLWSCDSRLHRQNIQRAERKAKECSFRLLAPLMELKKAIDDGLDDQEIADRLDISLDLLRKAVEYYRARNLLPEANNAGDYS